MSILVVRISVHYFYYTYVLIIYRILTRGLFWYIFYVYIVIIVIIFR